MHAAVVTQARPGLAEAAGVVLLAGDRDRARVHGYLRSIISSIYRCRGRLRPLPAERRLAAAVAARGICIRPDIDYFRLFFSARAVVPYLLLLSIGRGLRAGVNSDY